MLHKFLHEFATLFVVVNPIGTVPLFIAIAGHLTSNQRRRIAIEAIIISAVILTVFIAAGQFLLEALGIDLASFRIAGGLVLLIIALRMVLAEVQEVPQAVRQDVRNIAVFPLAMPFIAGPATMMAVVLLTDNNTYSFAQQVQTWLILLAVLSFSGFCLIGADYVQRVLGSTGANVVSRVMGLILTALAVQSVLGGLRQFLSP